MPPSAPSIEAVPLDRLHPSAWNPRFIRDRRFANLCQAIEADPDFLWQRPVLATADGTIYAGNMRYRAAQHLGWTTIPAIIADIPQQLAQERALRDNNQWGEWQEDDLSALVYQLQQEGSELATLGFDQGALETILDLSGARREAEEIAGLQPSKRTLPLDAFLTWDADDEMCCLAVRAGLRYGTQTGGRPCVRAHPDLPAGGQHRLDFIDNDYLNYRHDEHLAMVQKWRPKYCTVRDIMTEDQCERLGTPYYPLEQILEWAAQLNAYAEHVIVIPKFDCLRQIPEQYVLGYSVPTSHGATPLQAAMFKGRRVHLLGGSWKRQLSYLALLGDDVVSLDNNHLAKVAMYGTFMHADGATEGLDKLCQLAHLPDPVTNPMWVAATLSVGAMAMRIRQFADDNPAPSDLMPEVDEWTCSQLGGQIAQSLELRTGMLPEVAEDAARDIVEQLTREHRGIFVYHDCARALQPIHNPLAPLETPV